MHLILCSNACIEYMHIRFNLNVLHACKEYVYKKV
jgi:hypothetical protein